MLNDRLLRILKMISPAKIEISAIHSLKDDLLLDSILLVQLSIEINKEFSVDLGEKFDSGKPLKTVRDLEECIKEN